MDWLKTDDLTALLAVSFVAVYALSKYLKPQSLVHPLLLGRQADVGRVRMPGESAVYRNYATGIMGRLPERPKPEIKLLADLIRDEHQIPRTLWSTTISNAELKGRAEALGAGLTQIAGLTPRESTALLLLNDSIEFLITDLALASHSITSFTLTSLSLLIPTLEKHAPTTIIVQKEILEDILEHVSDLRQSAHHSIIVVGDEKHDSALHSEKTGIIIYEWEDIEAKGKALQKPNIPPPEPTDIFSVSFFADVNDELRGSQLSHANVTAGVTAARLLFPFAEPISPSDTLFSTFSIGTAYGRAIAYTAIYEGAFLPAPRVQRDSRWMVVAAGANFVSRPTSLQVDKTALDTSESSRLIEACEASVALPTIIFLTPSQLKPLTSSILETARSSPLFSLALRHKIFGLEEGFITKASFWDDLVLKNARTKTLGKLESTLRGIVVSGGCLEIATTEPSRIAFSIPIVSAHNHPLVCGPVMASHPLDLQSFPGDSEPHITVAHVGPPAPNVEIKLVGVLDTSVEKCGDPTGDILVRGPSVALQLPVPPNSDTEGWVPTGQKGRVQTNGTFKIL